VGCPTTIKDVIGKAPEAEWFYMSTSEQTRDCVSLYLSSAVLQSGSWRAESATHMLRIDP
jgi:hypothetical protein